ncbi:MAG: ABC transporter permease [Sulfolobus sp.]|nr:ABC transporter permease [Sulfolobus sp.]
MGFLSYAIRRAVDRFVLLLGLLIFLWFFVEALPQLFGINPAEWYIPFGMLGKSAQFYQNIIRALTIEFGFNKPLYVQFVRYLYNLLTFNLGYDWLQHEPVIEEIMRALPYTVALTVPPLIFQTILAILLGSYAALNRGKWIDHLISNYLIIQYNIPGFFIAAIFWVIFAVALKMAPLSGVAVIKWNNIESIISAYWVPWIILTLIFGFPVRGILMRNTMEDILDSDFIKYERLAGLREQLVRNHAIRNSLIPVITRTAIDVAFILGGIYILEYIFGIPGMGLLGVTAATELNIPLLVGSFYVLTFYALVILYINDLIYPLIDPRIKLR